MNVCYLHFFCLKEKNIFSHPFPFPFSFLFFCDEKYTDMFMFKAISVYLRVVSFGWNYVCVFLAPLL